MNERIFLSPPHMGGQEIELIRKAFESNYIAPTGPMVDAFEKAFSDFVGIRYSVALSSGTAAMHLALRNLRVGAGDEVFASTLTFIGSVSPIAFQGATPVFIDSDINTWNMDATLLEYELERCALRRRLPKAVVPTDLYGQCVDLERILNICERYNVPVICDCAESMGAMCRDNHAGASATAAIYSFNGNKIMTTSGGGMLASEDKQFIEKARFLSQQARDNAPHYEHSTIGYNYRMSNIVAAIGIGQLENLQARVEKKRLIRGYYRKALSQLPGVIFMPEAKYGRSNGWLTVILIDPELFGASREDIRLALEKENIESRPVWKPMHMQPAFVVDIEWNPVKKASTIDSRYPARVVGGSVAESLFENGLCLPSGTAMNKDDLDRIIEIIFKVHQQRVKWSA